MAWVLRKRWWVTVRPGVILQLFEGEDVAKPQHTLDETKPAHALLSTVLRGVSKHFPKRRDHGPDVREGLLFRINKRAQAAIFR